MLNRLGLSALALTFCASLTLAQQSNNYVPPGLDTENAPSFGWVDSASINCEILTAPTYPIGSPVQLWGKLKVGKNKQGVRCLCDKNGNPVQLRGMVSHGMQWAGVACLTESNIRALRNDWNTNVFRIAVYVDEEGGYAYNPTHRSRYIEDLVKWTAAQGMYLLIDWHVLSPGNPQSRVYRNRRDNGKDVAADFFTYCARRYQKQSHVLFELCNEPNGENYQNENFGGGKWAWAEQPRVTWENHIKPYCEQMLKIIRTYDKDVVVVCGTPMYDQNPEQVIGKEPVDENGKVYENIMYAFHFYAATHNDGQHYETAVKAWDNDFMTRFQKGDKKTPCILKELPIFVTEWGTTDASGWANFRPDLSDRWLKIFDGDNDGKQVVSWCNWNFSAEGGSCAALNWNTGNMDIFDEKILTESGKYIYKKFHEKYHTVVKGSKQ